MSHILHRIRQFAKFYASAKTKYQIHSPFVFDLVSEVLEDDRYFYAFMDIEKVREKMLESDALIEIADFGAGEDGENESVPGIHLTVKTVPLYRLAKKAGSSAKQGQRLFRLAHFFKPKTMLELGSSIGIGTMYLASAAKNARFLTLEGCENCAEIARLNLEILKLSKTEVIPGAFEITLRQALEKLKSPDFVFFDGNHRKEPTLQYFETCLNYAHEKSAFVFDDIYWSEGMTEAWEAIKSHPRVTATIDFYDLGVAIFNADFKEKQHFRVVPAAWKPWKLY